MDCRDLVLQNSFTKQYAPDKNSFVMVPALHIHFITRADDIWKYWKDYSCKCMKHDIMVCTIAEDTALGQVL